MNKRHYKKPLVRDKVDMSLDDIIRLNKKEQHTKGKQPNKNQQTLCRRRTPRTQGKTKIRSRNINGGVFQVGGGGAATKLRPRAIPGVRRIQGVVTGLAARRNATLLRRPAQNRCRHQDGPQWNASQQTISTATTTSPLCASDGCTPGHISSSPRTQGDGMRASADESKHVVWRTSTSSTGVLTVSIDNPTAMTQPEPPSAWTLHPATARLAASDVETAGKKIPKGVPLQFDINSVGKPQTSMTLNERFRILKEGRAKKSKGNRFVVVD
ncbi:UAP56-interacting factor isoform X5 [Hippocampus comes]|uniref:UAP56-interacting factor isoform X5 n=1 Tax=Hippocampus comes TaxID=109280 RepID=UPI00094EC336|nr:PREDICTED: UAP56-interacting factor isoform X5 [Hippocampus comes]